MIDCIIPPEPEYIPPRSAPIPGSYFYNWSDECCEDVVAKCWALPTKIVQHITFVIICEDKINLNRPPPVLEWQDDVEIWFGIVRLAHFSLRDWFTFQERAKKILEDWRWGHSRPSHAFFTTLRGSNFWDPTTKSGRVLYEQIHWILSHRQKLNLKECKLLEDMCAALAIRSNPPIELRFKVFSPPDGVLLLE